MYRLPAFKGAARQRGYGIGGLFKGFARTFKPVLKRGLVNLGKQALKSGVQVLDDVSRGENIKTAIKKRAVEGVQEMAGKTINRGVSNKRLSQKKTVRRSGPTPRKKKRVTPNLL